MIVRESLGRERVDAPRLPLASIPFCRLDVIRGSCVGKTLREGPLAFAVEKYK
jgi:hypothetical protein